MTTNVLVGFKASRYLYGGTGYIAGISPGILSVDALPASRPIELRLRDDNRNIISKQWSNPASGTYNFTNLDPYTKFDLIARDEPNYVYNDIIVGGVWPWTDSELILHGLPIPATFYYGFTRTYEITGGTLPYSIDSSSVVPTGVTATLTGKILTITAPTDPGNTLSLVIKDSSTVTKTIVITTLISASDPYFSSVAILLHFDGANASTTFTDVKGNVWTAGGSAQLSTTLSKYGSAALLLNGTTDYASTPNNAAIRFWGGAFTWEAWIKTTAHSTVNGCLMSKDNNEFVNYGSLYIDVTGGKFRAFSNPNYGNATGRIQLVGTTNVNDGVWHHVAWCSTGSTWYLFVDGSLQATTTGTAALRDDGGLLYIGCGLSSSSPAGFFNGRIDDMRITTGVCRYTADFVPPGNAFPDTNSANQLGGGTAGRFWRINMTATENSGTSSGFVNLGIISLRSVVGGENICYGSGGTATQSSVYPSSPTLTAALAFNKLNANVNDGNFWHSNYQTPAWWAAYDFGGGISHYVSEIAIADSNVSGRGPTSFDVQTSTDGLAWTTFKSFTGVTGWTAGTVKIFSLLPGSGVTQSLLHFDGTSGAITITDQVTRTWTRLGLAALSNTQSKFGGTSLYIPDADSNFNCPAGILTATDQFCIDGWIWCDPTGGAGGSSLPTLPYTLCGQGGSGGSTDQFFLVKADGSLRFFRGPSISTDGGRDINSAASTVPRGSWSHIMATYDGTTIRLYANGSKVGEAAAGQGWVNTGYPFTIGYEIVSGYPSYRVGHNGYIDEFRVVSGDAVFTGNTYTIPTSPY